MLSNDLRVAGLIDEVAMCDEAEARLRAIETVIDDRMTQPVMENGVRDEQAGY